MNPYEFAFEHPDVILFYAGIVLILLAWAFLSLRYTVRWAISFREGMTRWQGGLPDKKASNELALLMLTWAANLLLIGAFVHAVV